MFLICIPNINHDYINVISDEINMIIDKPYATFINNHYFYIVHANMNSSVSFSVNSYNGDKFIVSPNINSYNYNTISMYYNYYDNGIAKIYHEDDNNIIVLIKDNIIELNYKKNLLY